MNVINFTYLRQPAKKFTFQQPKLKRWTTIWSRGLVLNLFAGMTSLPVDEIRNDINEEMPADFHMDAVDFVDNWAGKFDTVILDPPYNWRKAKEKYGNRMIGQYPILKDKLIKILEPGSRVLSFGYDSVGMGRRRGFELIAVCLVCHSGDHHDTICIVEEMKYKERKLL